MIRISYLLFFVSTIFLTSCEGDSDTLDNAGASNQESLITLNEPCHYDITLLDTPYSQNANSGDRVCTTGSTGSVDPNNGMATKVPSAGLIEMNSGYGLEISKGTISYNSTTSSMPTNSEFEAMFEVGEYSFSMDAEDGFDLKFMDNDGVEWSSSKQEALANSNWLKINQMVSGNQGDSFFVTIQADYSCGVQNDDGEIKGCSGSFVMTFENN